MKLTKYSLLLLLLHACLNTKACTIFSAIDKNGHVWAGNNEDNIFNFKPYLNIVKGTDSTFGYIFFTNTNGTNEFMQGGANEAGLFYDGNSVKASVYKEYDKKIDFPGGHRGMLAYILKKCKPPRKL